MSSVALSDGRLTVTSGLTDRTAVITSTDYAGRVSRAVVGQVALEIIARAMNEPNAEYRANDFRHLASILEDSYRIQHGHYQYDD